MKIFAVVLVRSLLWKYLYGDSIDRLVSEK
jgi:hypothetical protein